MPRLRKKSEFQLRSEAKERTRRLRMMRRINPNYKKQPKLSESNEQPEMIITKTDSNEEQDYKAIRQAQIISDYSLRRTFPANTAVEQQELMEQIYRQKIPTLQNHEDTSSNESTAHSLNTNEDFQYRSTYDNSSEYSEYYQAEEDNRANEQCETQTEIRLQEQHNQLAQDCEVRLSRCDDKKTANNISVAEAAIPTAAVTTNGIDTVRTTIENCSTLSHYEYLRLQCELRRSNLYAKYKKKIKHGCNNICLCCGGTGFSSQAVKEINASRLPLTKISTSEHTQ